MTKQILFVFCIFVLILTSGCEKNQSSTDTVVMDLEAIANATGQAAIIKQQIETANEELKSQLNTIADRMNEQLANEKKKIESKPTKNDKLYLEQLTLEANQKMQQAKILASQKSQQYQAALIQKLRQDVSPIAEKIARKRGAKVVLIANSATLWFDPIVDITDEIIGELRANPLPQSDNNETTSNNSADSKESNAENSKQ
ncbi:MAG: hypothetical protein AMJ53_15445 [Gammaproteobacteria bacterium SG8_11]|nr:MAG: hypothetical protein AMJ53_15445 [Gammaproteobacteria bacterium SG8_11]